MPKVNKQVKELDGWVTANELADIWKVSRAHLSRLVKDGRINPDAVRKIGNQLVFDLSRVVYPEAKTHDRKAERDQAVKKVAMGA